MPIARRDLLRLGALGSIGLAACRDRGPGAAYPTAPPPKGEAALDDGGSPQEVEASAGPAEGEAPDFSALAGFCEGVPGPTAAEYAARRERAARALQAGGYAAVVMEAGVSLDYLTGVRWGRSERPLLCALDAKGALSWVGPSFEHGTLQERLSDASLDGQGRLATWEEQASPYARMAELIGGQVTGKRKLALDPAMRLFVAQGLREALGGKVDAKADVVGELRLVKTPAEWARIERANLATKAAIAAAAPHIRPGMRESDARPILRAAQAAAGLEGVWVLALFGPNAAFPHGTAAEHPLREGDLVLVDTGGSLHGYQSDVSRTWAIGEPPDEVRRAWDAVLEAQSRSLAMMAPGVMAGEVDATARAVIAERGFGEGYRSFTHRLGHGIGMQGHEGPYLRMDNPRRLAPGMTMSNEPGIYRPGQFGVRIEDIVGITESGATCFGPRPQDLEHPFGP